MVTLPDFDVGEVIKSSFTLVFENFGTYLGTQGLFIIALGILAFVQGWYYESLELGLMEMTELEQFLNVLPILGGSALLFTVAEWLLLMTGVFFGVVVTWGLMQGREYGLGEAWEYGNEQYGTFLLTALLITGALFLVFLVGTLLTFTLVAPLIALGVVVYLVLRWYPAFPISTLELIDSTDSLRRSANITDGAKGHIFGVWVAIWLIWMATSFVVNLILPAVEGALTATGVGVLDIAIGVLLNTILLLVFVPVFTASTVLVYERLRTSTPQAAGGPPTGVVQESTT